MILKYGKQRFTDSLDLFHMIRQKVQFNRNKKLCFNNAFHFNTHLLYLLVIEFRIEKYAEIKLKEYSDYINNNKNDLLISQKVKTYHFFVTQ